MTAIDSQNLARLEDSIAETKLVAMIRQEPAEIELRPRVAEGRKGTRSFKTTNKLKFCPSFDDLDYLVFATLSLPSGERIGLVRHDNSPTPGTEICVRPDLKNIPAVLQQAMAEMNLTFDDLTWIHPENEQQARDISISESEVEANALSDPDNQSLTPDSLKKVRRKRA